MAPLIVDEANDCAESSLVGRAAKGQVVCGIGVCDTVFAKLPLQVGVYRSFVMCDFVPPYGSWRHTIWSWHAFSQDSDCFGERPQGFLGLPLYLSLALRFEARTVVLVADIHIWSSKNVSAFGWCKYLEFSENIRVAGLVSCNLT